MWNIRRWCEIIINTSKVLVAHLSIWEVIVWVQTNNKMTLLLLLLPQTF
jgi:hypothetical protein